MLRGAEYYFDLSPLTMIQEPVLFSVSVGENIAYGLPDDYVSKDDVIKAAKAANAHEFIISLPQVGRPCNTLCFTLLVSMCLLNAFFYI